MANFQIHVDVTNEKENATGARLKGKAVSNQPLRIIKEKQALGPREYLGVLNPHNNQQTRGLPAPGGKAVLRDFDRKKNENGGDYAAGGSKKSSVVDQFKNFTVYEENSHTQVELPAQATAAEVPNIDKENRMLDNVKNEFVMQKEYDMDGTPMSVTDVLSPMSLDRSIGGGQSINDCSTIEDNSTGTIPDGQEILARELPPRNDRQRFFEVVQYQMDILRYFQESEKNHRPKPLYMRRQRDINHNMRAILIDWLVEVSEEYKLDTETLYLSVSYIDRFLSQMAVVRSKLQLVGTAAMYIASKYEEIYPPNVGDFVFLTDDSYTKRQVLSMEQVILKVLSFDLCTPTAYVFVNSYAVLSDLPEKLKYLTLFLCELSLMEGDLYLQHLPSLISSASLALARHMLGMEIWTPKLEEITTYKLDDLKTVMLQLCQTHKNSKELNTQAIREKYNREKYKKVATLESIELTEEQLDNICLAYHMEQQQQQQKQQKKENESETLTSLPPNSKSKANLFYKF